jgi:ribosomal protein L7/L12
MRLYISTTEAENFISESFAAKDVNVDVTISASPNYYNFLEAIDKGEKLQAMKCVRLVRKCSLIDAKNFVELFMKEYNQIPMN